MHKPFFLQILRLIVLLAIIIGCYLLFTYTFSYLFPIFMAVVLVFVIQPFVNFFENKLKFPRPLATFFVLIFMLLFLLGGLYLIFVEIYQGTTFLAEQIPRYFHETILFLEGFLNQTITPIYEKISSLFYTLDYSQQTKIQENLQELTSQFAVAGAKLLQSLFQGIPNLLTFFPNSFAIFIFTILATFLMSNDWNRINRSIRGLLPSTANDPAKKIIKHIKQSLVGFIRAQFILVFISCTLILIGLLLLQVEQAFTITLFAALVDVIPFIGTGIIFVPWIIYLFLSAHYSMTIAITILYMIIIITRQLLEPKILSSSIGLHPLVALICYFFGFQFWGLIGFLIAPALLILIHSFNQAGVFKATLEFIKG